MEHEHEDIRTRGTRRGFDARLLGRAVGCAAVVGVTVIGLSMTTGLSHRQVAHAATVRPVARDEAARLAEVDRVRANAAMVAEMWAADESSHGMRPDAAH